MRNILKWALCVMLSVVAAGEAFPQTLNAVKSYYPTYTKDNMGNTTYVTSYPLACYVHFYNNSSYVILEGNRYNYNKTMNSDYYYYPVNQGYKELIFSSDFKNMAYQLLDFTVMGFRSVSYAFFNYLGEGKEMAESYKQRQMGSSYGGGGYSGGGYGGGNYGGGNYGGGNYSGGNNNQPKVIKCGLCLGNGRCLKCSGRGHYTNPYGGGQVKCSFCNGTGICNHCNGTGRCTCNRNHHPNSCYQSNFRSNYY